MAPGSHQPTCGSTHAPLHHHLLRSGRFASLGLIALLVACGGGGGGSSGGGGGDPITYGVGVTAVGIVAHHDTVGQTLTLTLNEAHNLVLAATDNTHLRTFVDAELEDGASYEIVVSAHPFNQLCTVVNGEGTVEGQNVTEPKVHCHTTTLNDTGIDWCADGGANNLGCPVAGYPGQDGDLGRDAAARDGTLTRLGGGAAGFDYTRLDANGDDLSADAPAWSCVRDNVTGLIWEVKVNNAGSLHHRDWTYSWYDPDGATNGGDEGTENGGSCLDESSCDTDKFVAAVNTAGLCGASDWRMPTRNELLSLVHSGRVAPAIDEDYFPNTSATFWSSSSFARIPGDAWVIPSSTGQLARSAKKTNDQKVRLVREAQ